jgi:polar amino acid transport system substrate-binding protein
VVDDSLVAGYAAETSVAPAEFVVAGAPFSTVVYGVAVARDASGLRDAVQAALSELVSDGGYPGILARWGAGDGALAAPTVDGGS